MNNEEKAQEIAVKWRAKGLPYNAIYNSALEMARCKDEQVKQLLVEKTKLLSPSATQDSVKRCTIEEIYREMFNEEMPNSNPYIK